jgi:hypothetical protein
VSRRLLVHVISPLVVVQCDMRHRSYWCECLVSQDGDIGVSALCHKMAVLTAVR